MTREDIYDAWRPEASPWSRWVKPVLFSFLRGEDLETTSRFKRDWHIPSVADTAIMVDLPGSDGVAAGIALSQAGYRPIPVYNACPFMTGDPSFPALSITDARPLYVPTVVDVLPILPALCEMAKQLAAADLPSSAPPAFLLDSNRSGWTTTPEAGWFDNRSFVTSTDFPSAQFFKKHGVLTIVLVQTASRIQADLLQVLLVLQKNGLKITQQAPWGAWQPRPITVKNLPVISSILEKFKRRFNYQRNAYGWFGDLVPPSGS